MNFISIKLYLKPLVSGPYSVGHDPRTCTQALQGRLFPACSSASSGCTLPTCIFPNSRRPRHPRSSPCPSEHCISLELMRTAESQAHPGPADQTLNSHCVHRNLCLCEGTGYVPPIHETAQKDESAVSWGESLGVRSQCAMRRPGFQFHLFLVGAFTSPD